MNFTEVVNAVLGLVKRPDQVVTVENAVNSQLSRCTLLTTFSHDLVEAEIPLDDQSYDQTIDLSMLAAPLTRFRKWKYVKLPGVMGDLKPIDLENVFVPGGFRQRDTYYMVGNKLTIMATALSSTLLVGYYQYAPTLTGNQMHWLLDLCPYAIVNLAAGDVFNSIGDDKGAKYYTAMGQALYQTMTNDLRDQYTY